MVRAWIMDDSEGDQRLEHHRTPAEFVSLEDVKSKTGVLYCKLDPELEKDRFEELRKSREYSYNDVVEISPEKMPNYKEMITNFYKEHLHTDEEIRYVLAGSGYFDVRYPNDDWVRIEMEVGDLIVLPAGIYHRFTLDSKNYIKAMRLFKGEPVWTAHFKPSDEMDIRKCYAEQLEKGFGKIPDLL